MAAGDDLVAELFDRDKRALRPIFDALLRAVLSFGDDITPSPKKGYLSMSRSTQFATLHPSTEARFDVGLKLKGVAPAGRLEAAGRWNALRRLGEIGRGGMGALYRAMDRTLGREVALKVLAFARSATSSADGEAARITKEARVLTRLEHSGIVAVHEVRSLSDGRPFYVMRLVRGTNLARHAVGRGRGDLLRLFPQVCDAVAFAHARDADQRADVYGLGARGGLS